MNSGITVHRQNFAKCPLKRKRNKEKDVFEDINSINLAIDLIRTHAERKEVQIDDLGDSTKENETNNSFSYN